MKDIFFRAGVGAVIKDQQGHVLVFQRSSEDAGWQLPQGGIEQGESPIQAAYREIFEETGIAGDELTLLGEYPEWLVYEFPERITRKNGFVIGQAHRWFYFLYNCFENSYSLEQALDDEFQDWEWIEMQELVTRVVDFKKTVYIKLLGWDPGQP